MKLKVGTLVRWKPDGDVGIVLGFLGDADWWSGFDFVDDERSLYRDNLIIKWAGSKFHGFDCTLLPTHPDLEVIGIFSE